MVFTAPSVIPCDFLRGLLDVASIQSMLKNEGGSSILGRGMPLAGGPKLPFAWPEVWVNDEDYETASEIADEFQQSHPQDGMLTDTLD